MTRTPRWTIHRGVAPRRARFSAGCWRRAPNCWRAPYRSGAGPSLLTLQGPTPVSISRVGVDTPRNRKGDPMHILWALIIGLIVGAIAKLLMPGKDPGGVVITMLLGVAGSLVAGFLGRAFGWYHAGQNGPGIIASIIGAMILLFIYRLAL